MNISSDAIHVVLAPNRSTAQPVTAMAIDRASVYPVTTHWMVDSDACKSRPSGVMATLTIVTSRMVMIDPATTTSASFLSSESKAAGFAELPGGWREAVTAIARRTREVMLRHPWIVDTNAHGAVLSPNALRHLEESLTALRDLHLSPRDAVEVLTAIDKFTLGHATFEIADRAGAAARRSARPYFESLLATGEFPVLAGLLSDDKAGAVAEPQYERQFERGLAWLLDGIEAGIEAP